MTFCVVLRSLIYVQVHAYSKAVLPSPGTPQLNIELRVRTLVDHQPLYQVGAGSDPNNISPSLGPILSHKART